MIEESTQSGRGMVLLAVLILIFGCLMGGVLSYMGWRDLQALEWEPSLPDDITYDLTQVIMPGESEFELEEVGIYTVYYEYNSQVDGIRYATGESFPGLVCTLTDTVGLPVDLTPFPGTSSYSFNELEGTGIWSFTIIHPGTYTLNCRYPPGVQETQVVLAIGTGSEQDVAWSLLTGLAETAAPSTRPLFFGVGVICCSTGLAFVIATFTLIRQLRARAERRKRFQIDR